MIAADLLCNLDRLEGTLLGAQQATSAKCLVHIRQLVWLKLDERFDPAHIAGKAFLASVAHRSIDRRHLVVRSNHGKMPRLYSGTIS